MEFTTINNINEFLVNANQKQRHNIELSQNPSLQPVAEHAVQSNRTSINPLQSAPFGTEIGSSHGVIAYSNENSDYISHETYETSGIFSGMKWQCVEYARRFMQTILGMTFESVYGAEDIWFLEKAVKLSDGAAIPFKSIPNGSSKELPYIGSLIIYPISESCPFGHVAAVVQVDLSLGLVYLAEQNWDNRLWPEDQSYSRTVRLEKNSQGQYELIDESGLEIMGWKTTNSL